MLSGIIEYFDAQQFWIQETLKRANLHKDSLFKFYYPADGEMWVEQMGVLEGTAGIGLVLIDYLGGATQQNCLLNEALLLSV